MNDCAVGVVFITTPTALLYKKGLDHVDFYHQNSVGGFFPVVSVKLLSV